MKNLLKTLVLALFTFTSYSLTAQKISVGTDFGWANALGEFSDSGSGGLNWNAHARYGINEKLSVGLEYNTSLLVAVSSNGSSGFFGASLWGVSAYGVKGWYEFLDRTVSPYAAVGLGLSQVSEPDITSGGVTTEGASRFGFNGNGELGLKLGGVYLAYRLNFGARTPKETNIFSDISDLPVTTQNFVIGYRRSIYELD